MMETCSRAVGSAEWGPGCDGAEPGEGADVQLLHGVAGGVAAAEDGSAEVGFLEKALQKTSEEDAEICVAWDGSRLERA